MKCDVNESILIIHGLGVEGLAALEFFIEQKLHREIWVIDTDEKFLNSREKLKLSDNIKHYTEDTIKSAKLSKDMLYLRSPGIPPVNELFSEICNQGISHTTPTGYWLAKYAPSATVTITGTKGKSSTTSLLANLMRWAGREALELGNIGSSPFKANISDNTVCIVELSSYMMHDLPEVTHFHAVTSLYKEHTDWHGSHEAYSRDKLHPFLKNPQQRGLVPHALMSALPEITNAKPFEKIVQMHAGTITITETQQTIPASDLNEAFNAPSLCLALRNAIAIALAAQLLNSDEITSALNENLPSWGGLPSRQNIVPSSDGILWVDDALATVPEATLSALERWHDRRIHLLLGGANRGQDFSELIQYCVDQQAVSLYGFGTTGHIISGLIEPFTLTDTFEETIEHALRNAQRGDVILFSPAAPSEPPHANFTERSKIFLEYNKST